MEKPRNRLRFLRAFAVVATLLGVVLVIAASRSRPHGAAMLEILPKHFHLRTGERIHYTVLERTALKPRFADCKFEVKNPNVLRPLESGAMFEAVQPGQTELVVHTSTSELGVPIEVTGPPQPPLIAVPHSTLQQIVAKEFLFVGHANRDGFDHTAVAKPGIDRLVREAKKSGTPVVYWLSQEYPDWYTADRRPDYAIISEGQEHQIRVEAQRVTFAGGSFMFCLLRNVQMTLHGMLKAEHIRRINFVFPSDAIWVEDIWGPGPQRPYPAPMVLLSTLFARRAGDAEAYEQVIVPFLDRMILQFPVASYPANPPVPPLSELLKDWSIVVRFNDRFERVYRHGNSEKILLMNFQDVTK